MADEAIPSRSLPAAPPLGPSGSAVPALRFGERTADGCIHAAGLVGSVFAVAMLLTVAISQARPLLIFSVVVYGGGLLAMWACSALHNFAPPSSRSETFRRLDHAAIFVMIAGSYTPFALIAVGGPEGWTLFSLVWLAAVGGAVMKLRCRRRFERLSIALYLMLGWSVLPAIRPVAAALPVSATMLLVVGGVLYSVGVIFHLRTRLPYQNAIWHGFVFGGAACHFAAVLVSVLDPDGGI